MKKAFVNFAAVLALVLTGCSGSKPEPMHRVKWFNDGVFYETNRMAIDEERNRTNEHPNFFYTKTSISTNKVAAFYLQIDDRTVELGARDDGVIVWRKAKP